MAEENPLEGGRIHRVLLDALQSDRWNDDTEEADDEEGGGEQDSASVPQLEPWTPGLDDDEFFDAVLPKLVEALPEKDAVEAVLQGKFRTEISRALSSYGDDRLGKIQTHAGPILQRLLQGGLEYALAEVIITRLRGLELRALYLGAYSTILVDADAPEWVASVVRECSLLYLSGAFSATLVFAASAIEEALKQRFGDGPLENLAVKLGAKGPTHISLEQLLREARDRKYLTTECYLALDVLRRSRNRVVHGQLACDHEECARHLKVTAEALRALFPGDSH